jgi:hypothetical protein
MEFLHFSVTLFYSDETRTCSDSRSVDRFAGLLVLCFARSPFGN